MGHDHQPGAAFEKMPDGGQGRPDPGVVGDGSVLEGYVKIDAHENAFSGRRQVANR